jgi:arylsulfatase A-like enzyme
MKTGHFFLVAVALGCGLGLAWLGAGGGDAASSRSAETGSPELARARSDRLNVVLVVIDTLRADALGSDGNTAAHTPRLDAFSAEGLRFANAYAQAPATAPSVASLFTSTYPATHGVWNDIELADGQCLLPQLSSRAVTLAEALAEAGYQTAAVADGGWVTRERGLQQGFQSFDSETRGVVDRFATANAWLRRDARAPFFLFLHTYQVHTPYLPPAGYEDRLCPDYRGPFRKAVEGARNYQASGQAKDPFLDIQRRFYGPLLDGADAQDTAFLRCLYDAEVSLVDEQFGLLMDSLRANGLLETTVVIFTADHGEEFREHGRWKHTQLYEELLRVPLIVRLPGGPRGARHHSIELVDVMPSLLAELGVEVPATAVGRVVSFHQPQTGVRSLVAQINNPLAQRSVRYGALKAIFHDDRVEVFDLGSDPLEQHDLSSTSGDFLSFAEAELSRFLDDAREHRGQFELAPAAAGMQSYPEQAREELMALGYLGH